MVISFFGEVLGHPTSKRPLVCNDFQACSKTNNRAPLTRLAPPRDNEWRRSDIMSARHLRLAMPLRLYDDPFVGSSRRQASQGAGAVQSIRAPQAGR
jgi:hypothetical protein